MLSSSCTDYSGQAELAAAAGDPSGDECRRRTYVPATGALAYLWQGLVTTAARRLPVLAVYEAWLPRPDAWAWSSRLPMVRLMVSRSSS